MSDHIETIHHTAVKSQSKAMLNDETISTGRNPAMTDLRKRKSQLKQNTENFIEVSQGTAYKSNKKGLPPTSPSN